MTGNEPMFPSALEVDLYYLDVRPDNTLRIGVRLPDASCLYLDFRPNTRGHDRVLDVISEVTAERFRSLGERAVTILGMTPAENEGEAD